VLWSLTKIAAVLWGQGAWMAWSLIALLASHGVSFVRNYLMGGEYERANAGAGTIILRPISRVFFLQASLMAGGALAVLLGLHGGVLVAFVGLKICVDLFSHRREHRKMAEKPRARTSAEGAGGPVPFDPDLHTWEQVRRWHIDTTAAAGSPGRDNRWGDSVSVPYTM
jgi:hypothetical protein